MPTYIRVKQINQEELSGFFTNSISNQNSLLNSIIRQSAVINTGNQNISGIKKFFDDTNFGNIYSTGVGSFNINEDSSFDLSGNSIIFDHNTTTGKLQFSANSGIRLYHQNDKYNPNYAPITITTGNDVLINGNTSFGQYNFFFTEANQFNSKLRNRIHYLISNNLESLPSGLKNNNILNIYYNSNNSTDLKNIKNALKCESFIVTDLPENSSDFFNHNYISITGGIYSGKALKKIKYGTTIGNGYNRVLLKGSGYWHAESVRSGSFPYGGLKYVNGSTVSLGINNQYASISPAIIKPKTYHLETFYDIIVPSGGGQLRPLKFELPSSPGKIQGQVLNLAFHFEPDNTPQIVSGFYIVYNQTVPIYTGTIFTMTGASYAFSQKERIVCIKQGNFKEAPFNNPGVPNGGLIFALDNVYYYERW
jgi:hypothetical protein